MNFTTRSSRTRLSSFLDLLSSPHATIAPHVRQIILDLSKERFSIPKSVFVRIGALYALQSITLIEYTPGDHPRVEDIVTVLGSLVKLKHLELNYCSLESFIQLRDIVCACRGLERLCFSACILLQQHLKLLYMCRSRSPFSARQACGC